MADRSARDRKAFYVTTPIYYVNAQPHIGHAYTTLACDVMARFKRLDGFDVRLLTGTDEHGQKVQKSAAVAGVDPQVFCDRVSQTFRTMIADMNATPDDFIRTTEDRHVKGAQALWQAIASNGDNIYLDKYAGWYSVRDEAFFAEDELRTDEQGRRLAPSGSEVEWVEEPSYFFRLSQWTQPLLDFYAKNPEFIQPPGRRNEVVRFVEGGLRDLSISRTTFDWGIPVPGDESHIIYVWLDALANYITALGYPDTDGDLYRQFWPADVHVVGKDILRFHAVYWPAFLMAAGLPVPKRIFAHGHLLNQGEKMSKSLGNVIAPADIAGKYGLDAIRYFFLREVPFGSDGAFSHETIVNRINGDLANDIGNLAQRVLSMIAKNCDGTVPAVGRFEVADTAMLDAAGAGLLEKVRGEIDAMAFHRALESIWAVVGEANRYVDDQAPWKLRKEDPARMATVLFTLAEVVRRLAILIQPIMPDAMKTMLDQLAVPDDRRTFADIDDEASMLATGSALPKPTGVFPRYVDPGTDA
ncbi:methionine--tRNA ligase [Fodinicurvata sp. EGI_FJ10296]|uniref:methionine--tRNA ligase n=1 Tax=Fodinicurvata sp. EGI_FJ10296 TaxID=3231908 RepID=UPI003455A672